MYAMAPRTSHRIMLRCWNTCWNDCVSHRKSRSLERSRCSDAAMQQCRPTSAEQSQAHAFNTACPENLAGQAMLTYSLLLELLK